MKRVFALVALCALVSGCGTMQGGAGGGGGMGMQMGWPWETGAAQTCIFQNCTIRVTIVNDVVSVDVPKVMMYRGSRDIDMRWSIDTPGYEFRPDSTQFLAPIIFKGPTMGSAPSQFYNLRVGSRGKVATIMNRNTDTNQYSYTIRVYKTGSNPPQFLDLDPVIFNDF